MIPPGGGPANCVAMTWPPELYELRRREALARPLLCHWAARAHELVALEAGHGPVARGTRP